MKAIPKLESSEDAELVELCLGENRDAFASIIARYQSLICAIAYNACGDLGRSEDLAQDTFVTAWKRLGELKEPAKLKSWLCGIARNLSNNSVRRDLRTPTALSDPLLPEVRSGGANPHEQAVSREEEALVWRALEAIPADYREVMILFYREGQSAQAVGAALGLSEVAVWQRLSRGRVMLKEGVAKTVESALGRSVPGKAFTGAVLAALPVFPTSAKAATVGAVVAKAGASAKSAASVGSVGGWLGVLCFGYFSMKARIENTKSPRERQFMTRMVWVRMAAALVIFVLLLGVNKLNMKSSPLVRDMAGSVAIFGLAVYSVVLFEFSHHLRRRIQMEDGTFVDLEWMTPKKPRQLLSDAPGNNSKAHLYRIQGVLIMLALITLDGGWFRHWIRAVEWMALVGVSGFWCIRDLQWCPRFEGRLITLLGGVGMCGLATLFMYNLPHIHGQDDGGSSIQTEIVFNVVVVLVYAAFIRMLAWMHRSPVDGRSCEQAVKLD